MLMFEHVDTARNTKYTVQRNGLYYLNVIYLYSELVELTLSASLYVFVGLRKNPEFVLHVIVRSEF